jgi:hypothetical protein
LEAAAGSENPYAFMEVFGRGHLSTRAGAAVYITKCNPVSVQPRAVVNCTSEIPVMYNGTAMYVDPISYILRTHAVPIKCTDVAPPRFNIGGRWYCLIENRGLSECHEPLTLPISPVDIGQEQEEKWGLGRSIYSKEQLDAFHEFQMAATVRAAYVADSSELAFSRRGPGGEWGLGLGGHAQAAIVDLVGLSFVPLYRFLGPANMLVILVLFFVTILRLVFTVLFRVIVIGKAKGCGFYLFGALLGCVHQLIISPLKWADSAAQHMAKRVELGLIEGAEDNAGGGGDSGRGDDCGGHNGSANGHYPDLNEARNRERRYLNWGPWYRRGHYSVPQNDTALQNVPSEQERQSQDDCASAPAKE